MDSPGKKDELSCYSGTRLSCFYQQTSRILLSTMHRSASARRLLGFVRVRSRVVLRDAGAPRPSHREHLGAHFAYFEDQLSGCHPLVSVTQRIELTMSPRNPSEMEPSTSPDINNIRWFAGLAMQAIIAKQSSVPDSEVEREEIALWSYRMGQAMLATEARLNLAGAAKEPNAP